MSEQPRRESAKIYPFPSRSKTGELRPVRRPASPQDGARSPEVDAGAWYHEAALRDSEQPPRK
ncbi:DUF2735 domain-containing protein [Alsobacter sp. KACC 23698]|uniref:DUF2735 domain-containing protein n=1 Tax=Alsobacter sp. KACC 23698 TaxID=3149229 RepID=A0AAU7JK54_9HYPH